MAININLPLINGKIVAGINVDASLPEEKKLPILYMRNLPSSHNTIKINAVVWACDQFTEPDARKLFVNGIAGILDLGLVRHVEHVPDGDWRRVRGAVEMSKDKRKLVMSIISLEEMVRSVNVAVATKVNFWLTNHHTGQEAVEGYVEEVLEVFFKYRITNQLIIAAHYLGHFSSTLGILDIAGITGVRASKPVTFVNGASLTLSQDVKLRFSSMPAGTHRCRIAFEASKRLIKSNYVQYCLNVEDMIAIPAIRKKIMRAPIKYHIRASYLTGDTRADYVDTDMEQYLGRLGTFITILHKNSTLAKSPYIAPAQVENYEDYDANFRDILIRTQDRGRLVEEKFKGITPVVSAEVIQCLRNAYV